MGVEVLIFTDCTSKTFARSAGAYRIATELRLHGYTVQVVDHFLNLELKKVLTLIDKFVDSSTLFVGFSSTFMNLSNIYFDKPEENRLSSISDTIKMTELSGVRGFSEGVPISDDEMLTIKDKILSKSSKAKLVLGGAKADYFSQPHFDAFILGYADNSVIEYVRYIKGQNPFLQFTKLPDGRMVIDNDVDATGYDFQHSTIEYHESDVIFPGEVLPIEVARGCIFKCKFCAFRLAGKKKLDYVKDKDVLYREFMSNYEKFGVTKYIFSDDTYNDSVQKLEQFAEVFAKLPFKLEFAAYLRHDLITRYPEMADLLKESGLKTAIFGIETLNHTAGKLIGKGLDPDRTKNTLKWLREEKEWAGNILMSSGFIVGLPTETKDTVSAWAEELLDYSYPLDSFILTPLFITPGAKRISKSEFELDYKKYGYRFDRTKSSGWINDYWTFDDATSLANEIIQYAYQSGRITSYGFSAMMMQNYGLTWEQLHRSSVYSVENHILQKTFLLADDYYNRLIKYEGK